MATQYFRITGYNPHENYSFIIDSNGMFEKLWQFSSYLVKKGLKVLHVSNDEQFIDISLKRAKFNEKELILRATTVGPPVIREKEINGEKRQEVSIGNISYIP